MERDQPRHRSVPNPWRSRIWSLFLSIIYHYAESDVMDKKGETSITAVKPLFPAQSPGRKTDSIGFSSAAAVLIDV